MRQCAALMIVMALVGAVACGAGAAQSPSPSPSVLAGKPVPAQLDGAWKQVSNPTVVMILTGTNYSTAGPLGSGTGYVAVNGSEIDFYDGSACGMSLPGGVGKYSWTISAGLLMFNPLNSDPCPRAPYLADPKGWQKAS